MIRTTTAISVLFCLAACGGGNGKANGQASVPPCGTPQQVTIHARHASTCDGMQGWLLADDPIEIVAAKTAWSPCSALTNVFPPAGARNGGLRWSSICGTHDDDAFPFLILTVRPEAPGTLHLGIDMAVHNDPPSTVFSDCGLEIPDVEVACS